MEDPDERIETTQEHFDRFKRTVEKLAAAVPLGGWQLLIRHEELSDDAAANATTEIDQRRCVVRLNTKWPRRDLETPGLIEDFAVHEFAHCVLASLSCLAHSRFVTRDEVDSAEHEVVRLLVPLLEKAVS